MHFTGKESLIIIAALVVVFAVNDKYLGLF